MKRTVILDPHLFPESRNTSPVATVESWEKSLGQVIFVGETLVRLRASDLLFTVPSPETGVLAKRLVLPGESIEPGEPIAILGGVSTPLPGPDTARVEPPESNPDSAVYLLTEADQAIATHYLQSGNTTSQAHIVTTADISEPLRMMEKIGRGETINGVPEKLSMLPFVIAEVARSLKSFPDLNAHRRTMDSVWRKHRVHISVPSQTESGTLAVPVLHDANDRSVLALARDWDRLQSLIRSNALQESNITDATFTVSWSPNVLYRVPLLHDPLVGHLNFGKLIGSGVHLCLTFDAAMVSEHRAEQFLAEVASGLAEGRFLFTD